LPRSSTLQPAVDVTAFTREEDRVAYLDRVTDIPAGSPRNRLPLAGAGVARQSVEIRVASLLDGPAHLAGDLALQTPLDPARRGVHMSRFVEVAAAVMDRNWASLEEAAIHGVRLAAELQEIDRAALRFSAKTTVWRPTPITRRRSPDPIRVRVEADSHGGDVSVRVKLGASVMTACPCTAAFSHWSARLDLAEKYDDNVAATVMDGVLTYTHSQRAEVEVVVDAVEGFSFPECLAALDEATTMTRELLKRPDEHALVRAAHERPQFTEDVVRDVAAALACRAPEAAVESMMWIEARALESIHAHDVCARYEGTVTSTTGALRA